MINQYKEPSEGEIKIVGYRLADVLIDLVKLVDYNKVLSDEKTLQIVGSLGIFVNHAICKYIKGQIEHGGDITDRDLHEEIQQEIIDLFFYTEGLKWKEKK